MRLRPPRIVSLTTIALAVLLGCNKADDNAPRVPPKPSPAKTATSTVKTPAPKPDKVAKSGEMETRSAEHGEDGVVAPAEADVVRAPSMDHGVALGFLPSNTVFALRFNNRPEHADAWRGLALVDAFGEFETDGLGEMIEDGLASLREELDQNVPGGSRILDVLSRVRGECVLGVWDIDPMAAMMDQVPASLGIFAELGEVGDDVRGLLAEIADDPRTGGELKVVGEHRYAAGDDEVQVEIHAVGDWLALRFGPTSQESLDSFLERAPEQSFLTSQVVADAPTVRAEGEHVWVETFLNLDPVWDHVAQLAPDAAPFIDATGADRILGGSIISALAGDSFHDFATLNSKGGDILTKILSSSRLEPSWARYIPSSFTTSGVVAIDLDRVFDVVMAAVPPQERSMAKSQISAMERETGVRLREQVLQNFGPHFGVATRGDMLSALMDGGDFALAFVVQVRDVRAAQKLVDQMFEQMPVGRTPRRGADVTYHSITIPDPSAPPWLLPSFGFTNDALIIASSPDAFEEVVRASKSDEVPDGLGAALATAGDGVISVAVRSTEEQVLGLWQIVNGQSEMLPPGAIAGLPDLPLPDSDQVERFAAKLPDSVDIWRALDHAVQFEGRSPIGTLWVTAFPVAIAASVAIPNLMSARLGANEAAAIATLRTIASAQTYASDSAVVDRDGDGVGEYASLAELAGRASIGDGDPIVPPLLSGSFGDVREGCVGRSGYYFRVFLPVKGSAFAGEQLTGGAPSNLDIDRAERGFVAYAWPMDAGQTGNRVFAINQDGHMLYTDNGYPRQYYSGLRHPPAFDAASADPGTLFTVDPESPWREGQDGGFWMPNP